MCGINGFNFSDDKLIRKMNKTIRHRGPDGTGVFIDHDISLGHNRLAIIDLSSNASQPMTDHDSRFVIVYNGELYNFKELKSQLEYSFETESDTEVILAAYKKWGEDCVRRFNGIFAFAIWDKQNKELFIARDQIGVKPLYYFWKDNKFIFSSEIKSILVHDYVSRNLDLNSLNQYLKVLYVHEPQTMFKNIHKFPKSSYGVLKNNHFAITKYWEETPDVLSGNKDEILGDLKIKIKRAVTNQLISDRPVGVYLSGGIDSSVVLYNVLEVRGNVDTFSVGFNVLGNENQEKFNRDAELAKKTANLFGTRHNEIRIGPDSILESLEKIVWHADEPISNPTAIPMFELAKFSKNKVDVVLGGNGGDELFGGYERYRKSLLMSYYQYLPSMLREGAKNMHQIFKKLDIEPNIKRFASFSFQKEDLLKKVVENNFLNGDEVESLFNNLYFKNKPKDFENVFMSADRHSWLTDFDLTLSDKMSMASALEQRVPLLDKEVVEYASAIPSSYKINIFDTKVILKSAFKRELPAHLFNQPKRGWMAPAAKWIREQDIFDYVKSIISPEFYSGTRQLFKWNELENILKKHRDGSEYNLSIIWAILTFQIWAKTFSVKL